MEESIIDTEILNYLLSTVRNRVINDVLEDQTCDWKYLLALSENKKILKEKYGIDANIETFSTEMLNSVIQEFENNISIKN